MILPKETFQGLDKEFKRGGSSLPPEQTLTLARLLGARIQFDILPVIEGEKDDQLTTPLLSSGGDTATIDTVSFQDDILVGPDQDIEDVISTVSIWVHFTMNTDFNKPRKYRTPLSALMRNNHVQIHAGEGIRVKDIDALTSIHFGSTHQTRANRDYPCKDAMLDALRQTENGAIEYTFGRLEFTVEDHEKDQRIKLVSRNEEAKELRVTEINTKIVPKEPVIPKLKYTGEGPIGYLS